MARYMKTMQILGNGNFDRGKAFCEALADRLVHARKEHPVFAEGIYDARGVISDEHKEFCDAVESESPERQVYELIDSVATENRFWNGEHEKR